MQMQQMHTLNLTDEQLAIIATGLSELPYKLAAPVFLAINGQIAEAQQKMAETLTSSGQSQSAAPPAGQ